MTLGQRLPVESERTLPVNSWHVVLEPWRLVHGVLPSAERAVDATKIRCWGYSLHRCCFLGPALVGQMPGHPNRN